MSNNTYLLEKIENLPNLPGIYIYKNKKGSIIYVGKSKFLKKRVSSYFKDKNGTDFKTKTLVSHIADFDYIVTSNETEALILEDSFIKKYLPKYNIQLKDGKTYPYIKITVKELFPRVFITRQKENDGNKYFGPFVAAKKIKEAIDFIYEYYSVKPCKKHIENPSENERPCLNYQIGKCPGCCIGAVKPEDYRKQINEIIDILSGKEEHVIKNLYKQMKEHAEKLNFEEAVLIKKRYTALKSIQKHRQIIVNNLGFNADVLNIFVKENEGCIVILQIREGKLKGFTHKFVQNIFSDDKDSIFSHFILNYYEDLDDIPKRIYVPNQLSQQNELEKVLMGRFNRKTEIIHPERGIFVKLMKMAKSNAEFVLNDKFLAPVDLYKTSQSVNTLKEELQLSDNPMRIEGLDISNTTDNFSVGSVVCFINGKPFKKGYRHYKMRDIEGQNDFASMNEMALRHYKRVKKGDHPKPDLILIDGGKGQLSSVTNALERLELDIQVISIAKKLEEVFFPGKSESIILERNSPALFLLQRIRDEAHRFAITYNRKIRDKKFLQSELEEIDGIGKKTAKRILQNSSIDKIRKSSIEDLKKIEGIGPELAKLIYEFYHT